MIDQINCPTSLKLPTQFYIIFCVCVLLYFCIVAFARCSTSGWPNHPPSILKLATQFYTFLYIFLGDQITRRVSPNYRRTFKLTKLVVATRNNQSGKNIHCSNHRQQYKSWHIIIVKYKFAKHYYWYFWVIFVDLSKIHMIILGFNVIHFQNV